MVAHSRRASQSTSNNVHDERDSEPSSNEYELVRDRRKKALHDRMELALLESGFGEAAKLHSAFSGEGTTSTPASRIYKPRRQRIRVGANLTQERRWSARNVPKTSAVVTAAPTSEVGGKKRRTEEFSTWQRRLRMKGSKRKELASPEVTVSDDDDKYSPEPRRGMILIERDLREEECQILMVRATQTMRGKGGVLHPVARGQQLEDIVPLQLKGVLLQSTTADTATDTFSVVHPPAEGLIEVRRHQNLMADLVKEVDGGPTVGRGGTGHDQEDLKSTLHQHTVMSSTASTMTCRTDEVGASTYA